MLEAGTCIRLPRGPDTCALEQKRIRRKARTEHTTIACGAMMEVKIKKHTHLPISLLPYHTQRPDLLEAGAC